MLWWLWILFMGLDARMLKNLSNMFIGSNFFIIKSKGGYIRKVNLLHCLYCNHILPKNKWAKTLFRTYSLQIYCLFLKRKKLLA